MIDIGDLDYEWQLEEAAKSLMKFVKQFDLSEIGLTYKVMDHVCPEANKELFQCISDDAKASVDFFTMIAWIISLKFFKKAQTI